MSAAPTGLSEQFWLAAHDGHKHARVIGDTALGIGLATALLAELVHGGWCRLRQGRLHRGKDVAASKDPALLTLLNQMKIDERAWPAPQEPRAVRPPGTYVGAHAQPPRGQVWPPAPRPAPEEFEPCGPGHDVGEYLSWLVLKDRAERLVGARLARIGLARREEHRRMWGGPTVRYVPCEEAETGFPASAVVGAARFGHELPWAGLFLVGLFLATGLDQHALFTLTPAERATLLRRLSTLDPMSAELLLAADAAVGDAATR